MAIKQWLKHHHKSKKKKKIKKNGEMLSLLSFSNLTTSSQPASPRWVGYSAWHHPCTLSNSSHMLSQMRPLVGKNLRLREEHSDVKKKTKKTKTQAVCFQGSSFPQTTFFSFCSHQLQFPISEGSQLWFSSVKVFSGQRKENKLQH